MAWETSREHGWELTVLRPGFIWGLGNECPSGSIGRDLGPLRLVFSPGRSLPFTHVDNCADCFCVALENEASVGQSINVIDGYELTAWQFMGEIMRHGSAGGVRVPLPYLLLRAITSLLYAFARVVLGSRARLPSLIRPAEIAQLYRPLDYSTRGLRELLGWSPPLGLEECLKQTFRPTKGPFR
jgi:nucleoside-diphosphate-sugar epimerase